MTIGLVDVDGHRFPNLALMKLSAWHKKNGDSVEFASLGKYDRVYYSKVFTFTPDFEDGFIQSDDKRKGGTGYKVYDSLPDEIEHICPDYSLYNADTAYGFLTRGCIRACPWCIVPTKEGKLRNNADITEFIGDKKSAILMDNNPLAIDWGLEQIAKIVDMGIKVDFNQGLDARIIADNPSIAELLAKVKWLKPLRMACDTKAQIEPIRKATELLRKYGCKPSNYFVYILVKDIQDALERVEICRELKLDPFAQPYRNFENNYVDPEAKRFARWVNRKEIFKSSKWQDYQKQSKEYSNEDSRS